MQHARVDVAPRATHLVRAIDRIARSKIDEPPRAPIGERDRGVATQAVRARVQTSAVRIHAVVEADVGRIVAREDRARVIFDQPDLRRRRPITRLVLDGDIVESVLRIGCRSRLHAETRLLRIRSVV